MKRERHMEEQIIAIPEEHEAGMSITDLRRKHGISEASFYNWKARYGGLEVSGPGETYHHTHRGDLCGLSEPRPLKLPDNGFGTVNIKA